MMWMASKSKFPPTIDEVRWRDRRLDEEIAAYRMMLEFYIKYQDRPDHLKDDGNTDWLNFLNGGKANGQT